MFQSVFRSVANAQNVTKPSFFEEIINSTFFFDAAEPAKPEPKGGTTPMGGVGQVMTYLYNNYLISNNILFI